MPKVEAILLGAAQDAGVPQAGCRCPGCTEARERPSLQRYPVSLGIVNHDTGEYWIIDSTPAFKPQLDYLLRRHPGYELQGIVLTHAHIGHYTGLIHLGKEAWDVKQLPLFATSKMIRFLRGNEPWSRVLLENLDPIEISSGVRIELASGLSMTPISVPHRAEFTDTLAIQINTGGERLFYCPDVDSWADFDLVQMLEESTIALLDGTFYSGDELPGRDLSEIPHPFVIDTIAIAHGASCEVWFIHLNHSNPLTGEGLEFDHVLSAGMGVATQWQSWVLS